ncbi:aldehyde dehydrogenase [Hymenopellis radicata]|nr:aldehyde dehydrogenase [Hymenopellis radicata]
MPTTFTHKFDTPTFKGTVSINTGLFIGGKFVDPVEPATIDVINPATGKVITSVAAGSAKDVDIAVKVAKEAYKTSWGLKVPGSVRGKLMNKLADLIEKHTDEFAALESLNVGKPFLITKAHEMASVVATIRYYAGWADKIQGKTIETTDQKLAYTRHEPYGVVGQIVPWNFPLSMISWKIGPALATGNTIVLKPSELTPLTALRLADLVIEAGFPPGVLNIVNGYGMTVGQAISENPIIEKIAFTGSTLTGRKIQEAAARSNLKTVTLELGGKSPNIIFDDADLDQAVKWASLGIFFNMGQCCNAGSRIFVQEGIYDQFLAQFTEVAKGLVPATGILSILPRSMVPRSLRFSLIKFWDTLILRRSEGATIHIGGSRHGSEGYFIQPTLVTECKTNMKIVQEEVFGPVAAIIKFKTEEEVIEMANDTVYGLSAAVFTENSSRAIRVAHALESGQTFVNCFNSVEKNMPFGGYKQSGIGRELGEYALDMYTQVKAVHINIGMKL